MLITVTLRTVASEPGQHSKRQFCIMVKSMNFFKGPGFKSLFYHALVGKWYHLSEHQLLHLSNKDDDIASITGLL